MGFSLKGSVVCANFDLDMTNIPAWKEQLKNERKKAGKCLVAPVLVAAIPDDSAESEAVKKVFCKDANAAGFRKVHLITSFLAAALGCGVVNLEKFPDVHRRQCFVYVTGEKAFAGILFAGSSFYVHTMKGFRYEGFNDELNRVVGELMSSPGEQLPGMFDKVGLPGEVRKLEEMWRREVDQTVYLLAPQDQLAHIRISQHVIRTVSMDNYDNAVIDGLMSISKALKI